MRIVECSQIQLMEVMRNLDQPRWLGGNPDRQHDDDWVILGECDPAFEQVAAAFPHAVQEDYSGRHAEILGRLGASRYNVHGLLRIDAQDERIAEAWRLLPCWSCSVAGHY